MEGRERERERERVRGQDTSFHTRKQSDREGGKKQKMGEMATFEMRRRRLQF